MTMTVAALHKRLGALIEAGHGRKPVLVDRATFSDPRDNDGLILMSPWAVHGPRWIANADDDGGTKWNKDGTESGQRCVLIVGAGAEPEATARGVDVPRGPLEQMAAGIEALDEGHDPLCMAVLRGKACTCGVQEVPRG